jgi:hypothetical protein
MKHSLAATFLAICIAPAARAQDMPLSQILIDGQEWKKADTPTPPATASVAPVTRSADATTLFRWQPPSGRFIEASPAVPPNQRTFHPYCSLRVGPGGQSRVTALTGDKDGRIYAATPLGIQVFDPTGRLCGVMAAPPGQVDRLAFESDHLVTLVADGTYRRRLNTAGVPRGRSR